MLEDGGEGQARTGQGNTEEGIAYSSATAFLNALSGATRSHGRQIDKKFDKAQEKEAIQWIEQVSGMKVSGGTLAGLKNGVVLCTMLNAIAPGTVDRFTRSPKHALEERVRPTT